MTKRKIALIIAASILAAILLAVVICVIIANSKNDNSKPTDELANWMSMIQDDTLLKNIVIPGAHDAGTKGMPYFAETQDRDITDLLNCGTRYLDLRVSQERGELKMYHGPSKGVALESVLSSAKNFVTSNPTETLILDFQHFDEPESQPELQNIAIKMVEKQLDGLLVVNNTAKNDVAFIEELTIGEMRGKCLVVWGREESSILAKSYVFKRNNDSGDRTDSTIQSYYTGFLNKKSSNAYINTALPTYIDKYKTEAKGLFVLQGQLTDGMYIFGPRLREATHTDNMDKYLDSLKSSDDLQYINIVIRDFITPSKNCYTLQLNLTKQTVKADSVTAYEKMIADNIVAR